MTVFRCWGRWGSSFFLFLVLLDRVGYIHRNCSVTRVNDMDLIFTGSALCEICLVLLGKRCLLLLWPLLLKDGFSLFSLCRPDRFCCDGGKLI